MNFGGMPRGGGRKVTHRRFVLGYAFSSLTRRTLCGCGSRAAMRREIQSIFFFLLSRAS